MQNKILKLLMTSLVLVISGCNIDPPKDPPIDHVVYKTTPIYAPSRPELPTWTYNDMKCLSPEMIQKISKRDKLRVQYIEQLETVIKSTQ